jgi:hypothetical protein
MQLPFSVEPIGEVVAVRRAARQKYPVSAHAYGFDIESGIGSAVVRCAVGFLHTRRGFFDGVPDPPPRRGVTRLSRPSHLFQKPPWETFHLRIPCTSHQAKRFRDFPHSGDLVRVATDAANIKNLMSRRTDRARRHAQAQLQQHLVQKPWIVSIPGTREQERLDENIGRPTISVRSKA